MKVMGRREGADTKRSKRRKVTVDILGRGQEPVTVTPHNTVAELRESLDLGRNVRAVDKKGNILRDNAKLYDEDQVNFVPNVKGGQFII